MDKRVLFIAQGGPEWASSRYRAWWVAKYAEWADCVQAAALDAETWDETLERYDVIVYPKWTNNRAQRALNFLEPAREHGKKLIWDVCDPIWWLQPYEGHMLMDIADHIVVSSNGLVREMREAFGLAVTPIPDRMDPAFHRRVKQHAPTAAPVLLWFGFSNKRLNAILSAGPGLALLATGSRFRLRVLDDGPPGGIQLPGVDVEYHPWRLDTFEDELLAADIALIPKLGPPWGHMASENKTATAYWAGLPVVTLDAYNDVAYARGLLDSHEERAIEGAANREYAELHYDVRQSVEEWEHLIGRLYD